MLDNNELIHKYNRVLNTIRVSKAKLLVDPNTSLIKLRQALEFLLEYIYIENDLLKENDIFKSIEFLKMKNIIHFDTADLFHKIRRLGNKAVHEGYFNIEETKLLLKNLLLFIDNNILEKENIIDLNDIVSEPIINNEEAEKKIVNLLVNLFYICDVPVWNDTYDIQKNEKTKYKVTGFSISTKISEHKDYKLYFYIYNGRVQMISSPIIENISEFEKHMYINMINYMNVNTFDSVFFIKDNSIYAKTVKYYPELNQTDFIMYDIFHSSTNLVSDIMEFLILLIPKKEGTI